jgi:uncharacterized Zn finger protein
MGKITSRYVNECAKQVEVEREWLKANGQHDYLHCQDCGVGLGVLYVKLWENNVLSGGLCMRCAQIRIGKMKGE